MPGTAHRSLIAALFSTLSACGSTEIETGVESRAASVAPIEYGARIAIGRLNAAGAPLVICQPAPCSNAQSAQYVRITTDAPYSIARVFSVGGDHYLFLFSAGTGRFITYQLQVNGTLGAPIQSDSVGAYGWRGAEIVTGGAGPALYLLRQRDGWIRSFPVASDGTIDLTGPSDAGLDDLEGKDLVGAFAQSGDHRLFALDRSDGAAVVLTLPDGDLVAGGGFPLGFSEVDHMTFDDERYRLMVKEVGHPYQQIADNGTEAGRAVVVRLDDNGFPEATLFDQTQIARPSSARFFDIDDVTPGFFEYSRDSGAWKAFSFDGYVFLPAGQTSTLRDMDEVSTYRAGGTTFVVGVQLDQTVGQATRLGGEPAAKMAQCIHDNLDRRVVGYQFALMQNGVMEVNRAHGMKQLAPVDEPMSRQSRINMGSVGKTITAITSFAVADLDGTDVFDVDSPIAYQLDQDEYPPEKHGTWVWQRTPLELMAHVSGLKSPPDCDEVGDTLTVNCGALIQSDAELTCTDTPAPGQLACPYDYTNGNFGMLRQIVEFATGLSTTIQIDELTHTLWMDSVLSQGPSCRMDSLSKYFGLCDGVARCNEHDDQFWTQVQPDRVDGWSRSCGAGGWDGSAQDMVRILEALSARTILSPDSTARMLSVDYRDRFGAPTAVGFDPPVDLRGAGVSVLRKGGYAMDYQDGGGTQAEIHNLEGNAHAALLMNTNGDGVPDAGLVLQRAYGHGLLGKECSRVLGFNLRDSATAPGGSEVAIATVGPRFVTAVRDEDGSLVLRSWESTAGSLTLEDSLAGPSMDQIRIAQIFSSYFLVAGRDVSERLMLEIYRLDIAGNIELLHSLTTAEEVQDLELVPLGWTDAEFATVVKTADQDLRVMAWHVDPLAEEIVELGTRTIAGSVQEVAAVAAPDSQGRIFVVMRTADGRVKPTTFQVSSDGMSVVREAKTVTGTLLPGSDVRVARVWTPSGWYYASAARNPDGKLELTSWRLAADATSISLRSVFTAGQIVRMGFNMASNVNQAVFVPAIDSGGQARLLSYGVSGQGNFTAEAAPTGDAAAGMAVLSDPASPRHFTVGAILETDGTLTLMNWELFSGRPD